MEKNDQQNFMLAIGLILVIMLASQYFLWGPNEKARLAEIERQETALSETTPAIEAPALPRDRNDVLKDEATEGARISFDAPAVDGSISVKGARIDDLSLKRHFTTVDKEEEVHLLTPRGAQNAFYAFQGWSGEANDLPNANTLWKQIGTGKLTPTQPVTLTYANGELTFERVIAIDDNYMFTITDKVTNTSGTEVVIRPYGAVRQHGLPDGWKPFHILHEGAIGMAGTKLKQQKYKNLDKMREGDVHDNFEFVKGYSVDCYQRNVLLKYKAGALEIQRGQGETLLSTKKRSIGGGIDMKTNVAALELVAEG